MPSHSFAAERARNSPKKEQRTCGVHGVSDEHDMSCVATCYLASGFELVKGALATYRSWLYTAKERTPRHEKKTEIRSTRSSNPQGGATIKPTATSSAYPMMDSVVSFSSVHPPRGSCWGASLLICSPLLSSLLRSPCPRPTTSMS